MTVFSCSEFGQEIRKQRKKMGYTQTFVSEVTGLSVSFISDVERGKETVELGKALCLANMLGLDMKIESRG